MSDIERSNEFAFSVVTAHPTRRQRPLAPALAGLLLLGVAALARFAAIPLLRLDSCIPSIQVVVSITSIITAVLLFGQFSTVGSRGVLVLAAGYLFVALIVISHTLAFPGAFSLTGLIGAGVQTGGWLFVFWYFVFSLLIV